MPASDRTAKTAALRCDVTLRRRIAGRLTRFEVIEQRAGRAAAVALIVVEQGHGADLPGLPRYPSWQNGAALLLTKRSTHLRRHAGQWALPGGRIDHGETPLRTALRETAEEVSLTLTDADLLGRLDDVVSRSGFVMSPFVFWAGRGEALRPDPEEVASIHRLPLDELLRADAPMLDYDEFDADDNTAGKDAAGKRHPVLRMPVGERWIAAPTAAILYQFREVCLLDRPTRVAHFEQPKFAWR